MANKPQAKPEIQRIKPPYQKLALTAFQKSEFLKCALDPAYFISNYVWVQHPTQGRVRFHLFDYQTDMIHTFQKHKRVVTMCSRQLGKTTTAAAFVLWFTCFQNDQKVLISSNIFRAATEFMDRLKFSYEELPDWLRPGVVTYNVQTVTFDNGSKIESVTTTPTSGRGKSISLLICDELAFVKKRIADEFWSAISPTLATGGKCIVISTPNSDEDTFAQIWFGACKTSDEFGNENPNGIGVNGFKSFCAYWWQHPDRDEEWARNERASVGVEKFEREYELKFISADDTLIDSRALLRLESSDPVFKTGEVRWFEPPQPNVIYCVGLDPSAGVGRDYAAIQVWRLPDLVQVAEWKHNKSTIGQQLKMVIQICAWLNREIKNNPTQIGEPDIFWTFENNSYGQSVIELLNEIGWDVVPAQLISEPGLGGGRLRRGLHTNTRTKANSLTKLKTLLETNKMQIRSRPLISEFKTFVCKGDSFGAKSGENDDLVMSTMLIVRMSQIIAKWDDATGATLSDTDLQELDDFQEPMPMTMAIW
jgi:Terminase large subunit, T4likevirus-type, N-terminal/Terminase RNaseH-like domain